MKTLTFEEKVKKAGSYKNYWTNLAKENLLNCKVVKVKYMSDKELEYYNWCKNPLCILMQRPDKTTFWLIPSMDDEGNDGGALFTTIKNYDGIPTL